VRRSHHLWFDHCTFDDGDRPDAAEPQLLGHRMQRHDGLLDITQQASFVTVSWNRFSHHDKTSLVGSSDKQVLDEGRLKVTYHHNLWWQTKERSPRVRWGQVHVVNNLYVVDDASNFGYSLGVGHRSALFSEHNAWQLSADVPVGKLVRVIKGEAFFDSGSTVNGAAVDLLSALRAARPELSVSANIGWAPDDRITQGPPDAAADVAGRVRAAAGAGRLWAGPD
jgi:pectate lyase